MSLFHKLKSNLSFDFILKDGGAAQAGGQRYVCPHCPPEEESEPALSVKNNELFSCFRCRATNPDASGDIIKLYKFLHNLNIPYAEVAKRMGERFNIGISKEEMEEFTKEQDRAKLIEKFINSAYEYLQFNPDYKKEIYARGLSDEDIELFRIGYFNINHGHFKSYQKYRKSMQKYSGRFIIPIPTLQHGFSYFTAYGPSSKIKYINLEGEKPVFGFDSGVKPVIITEGVFDFLVARSRGHNVLSTLGSGGRDLMVVVDEVILAFDNDDQGRAYTLDLIKRLYGKKIQVALFNEGSDLAEHLQSGKKLMTTDMFDYLIGIYEKKKDKKTAEIILQKYKETDLLDRSNDLKKRLAKALDIDVKTLVTAAQEDEGKAKVYIEPCPEYERYHAAENWVCANDGLYFRHKKITSRPILITDQGTHFKTGDTYSKIWYKDSNGVNREVIWRNDIVLNSRKLTEQSKQVTAINSINSRDLVMFFNSFLHENNSNYSYFKVVEQLGWNGDSFVPPDAVFAPTGAKGEIHYVGGFLQDVIAPKGDYDIWKNCIKKLFKEDYLKGASVARFCLYASLASIALKDAALHPIVIHLYGGGRSSCGKTNAMSAALSMYGDPQIGKGLVDTWESTKNGLRRSMVALKNIPKGIDELSTEGKNDKNDFAYVIGSGTEKRKATMDSSMSVANTESFQLVCFSTGERGMVSGDAREGANVRSWELGLPYGNRGEEDDIGQGKFVEEMEQIVKQNYGHCIRDFIPKYMAKRDCIHNRDFHTKIYNEKLKNREKRILKHFNLIYNIGVLFAEGIMGCDPSVVFDDCATVFSQVVGTITETKDVKHVSHSGFRALFDKNERMFVPLQISAFDGSHDIKEGHDVSKYGNTSHFGLVFERDLFVKYAILEEWIDTIFPNRMPKEVIKRLKDSGKITEVRKRVKALGNQAARYYKFENFFDLSDLEEGF